MSPHRGLAARRRNKCMKAAATTGSCRRLFLLSVWAVFATSGCVRGQDAELAPRSWAYRHLSENSSGTAGKFSLQLELADPVAYLERHKAALGHNARNVVNIAAEGWREQDLVSAGKWERLADGTCIWRLSIVSGGAQSHVLVFSDLSIPWGGEFSVFSPGATAGRTKCGASCMRVTPSRMLSRKLTTVAMHGEEVVLEYHHPEALPPESTFAVRVASILQGLPGSLPEAAEAARRRRSLLLWNDDSGYTPGAGFDMSVLQRRSDVISQCTKSVRCDHNMRRMDDAVVDIYAINLQLGAMAVCTGTLITAPLNRKYLLTADHCFVDKKAINNFEYWVLIFNYEVPCGGTDPPDFKQVIQGVRLVFYDSRADVLLLDITATIPDKFTPYLLGFDASEDAVPDRAIGIHHPNGNVKRISYANSSDSISTDFVARKFPNGEIQPTNTTHLQVTWTDGATASGSSGSPLIDVESGKIVGVLTGGFASCASRSGPDYYGRLSAAWMGGLENFLSNAPGEGAVEDVAEVLTATSNGGEIVVRTMNSTTIPKHGPGLGMYPSYLTFDPDHHKRELNYFLTDPLIWDNETIAMEVTVRGSYPGNMFDMTPYVQLSDASDNFTAADIYRYRRSIRITTTGLEKVQAAPGNIARFQLIFRLTSDVNSNYLHIHTMKGILVASRGPWSQYKAMAMHCDTLPCIFNEPGRAANDTDPTFDQYSSLVAGSYGTPTLAMFSFKPDRRVSAQVDICLEQNVLYGATVSIYIDNKFTWTIGRDPFGDPNCVHIGSVMAEANQTYTVVVSDQDDFDAVLPARTVKYITVADTEQEADTPDHKPGPVEGPPAGAVATKSEAFTLPSNALVDGSPLPAPEAAGAPAPEGAEVIVHVGAPSSAPAHAPLPAFPPSRSIQTPPKRKSASAAVQKLSRAAQTPAPALAQALPPFAPALSAPPVAAAQSEASPVIAPAPEAAAPEASRQPEAAPSQPPPPLPVVREAMSYTTGGR